MLALALARKPAPPELAAPCRSVSALEAPSTSDGLMPPLLALPTSAVRAAVNFWAGATKILHSVGLPCAAVSAAFSRLITQAPAAAALTRARIRPLAPFLSLPSLAGV